MSCLYIKKADSFFFFIPLRPRRAPYPCPLKWVVAAAAVVVAAAAAVVRHLPLPPPLPAALVALALFGAVSALRFRRSSLPAPSSFAFAFHTRARDPPLVEAIETHFLL